MAGLSETQLLLALLAVALILALGRAAAELARRSGQSEVLGELLAGVLLGPSVLGALVPALYRVLFLTGPVAAGLSLLSWIGAILLLLIAGMEVDPLVLRRVGKASALAAVFAIGSSLAVGIIFALLPGPPPAQDAFFLGIILSVTGVSVVSAFLLERDLARRNFAQVILVAGVTSETLAWLLVALTSSIQSGSPLAAGQSLLAALLFFLIVMTVGRRLTFWAMRRVTDLGHIAAGQLTLVLVLALCASIITQWFGLHALLGAFAFGIVLGRAPRNTAMLAQLLRALTLGVFGPIFFVLAGMRVDIFQLRAGAVMVAILLLLLVATLTKVGLGTLGARVGGQSLSESLLVGIGLNFKGGTDVVVAIIGVELGLLSGQAYTMYTVVAVLTVFFSVPLFTRVARAAPPAGEERARLEREEVKEHAYFPHVERIVVPLLPDLLPQLTSGVVDALARAKEAEGEFFDITELALAADVSATTSQTPRTAPQAQIGQIALGRAEASLDEARHLREVDLTRRQMKTESQVLDILRTTPSDGNVIVIGGCRPADDVAFSLGSAQDRVVGEAMADLLVVIDGAGAYGAANLADLARVRRILVPVIGVTYSLAGSDLAAYLAKATGAELLLVTVVPPGSAPLSDASSPTNLAIRSDQRDSGRLLLGDAKRRLARLDISVEQRLLVARTPADAIVRELTNDSCQLIVLGVVERSHSDRLELGGSAREIVLRSGVPVVLLVTH